MADDKSGRHAANHCKGISRVGERRSPYVADATAEPRAARANRNQIAQHSAAKPARDMLHEAGARATELARNPVARSLLAAGLVTAAAALASHKTVRDSARRDARQAQAGAKAAAVGAADNASMIGAAMINAATGIVRRMIGESAGADPIETSEGSGLGELLTPQEGRARLTAYAGHRSIESWAGEVAGPGKLRATLGIPRSTLNDWRRRGAIIGLLRGQRKHVYPLEQFLDARPLPGIDAVSEAVGNTREAWLWLRQPHGRFDMKTPLRVLGEGGIEQVVEAAARDFH